MHRQTPITSMPMCFDRDNLKVTRLSYMYLYMYTDVCTYTYIYICVFITIMVI